MQDEEQSAHMMIFARGKLLSKFSGTEESSMASWRAALFGSIRVESGPMWQGETATGATGSNEHRGSTVLLLKMISQTAE